MEFFNNVRKRKVLLGSIISVLVLLSFFAGTVIAMPGAEKPSAEQESTGKAPEIEKDRNNGSIENESGASDATLSPQDLQNSFRNVAKKVLPVVVEVNVVEVIKQQVPKGMNPFEFFFGPQDNQQYEEREYERPGLGSGVIVQREGNKVYVLTNNHVVGDADKINIRLDDKREFEADIVGKDPRRDLAVVMFETKEDIPVADLGNSDNLQVGDWALAVGNPYGFESTVTAGIISAIGRTSDSINRQMAGFTDYIQTDAAINPGNSGGALVNLQGEIIGINTWIASRSGGSVGLGFAIPINNAKSVIDDIINEGKVTYGWLGVSILDLTSGSMKDLSENLGVDDKSGAFVVSVTKGSPAVKAGLRPGDYITKVNNSNIKDSQELTREIGTHHPGDRVEIEYIRLGETQTATVRLTERASEEKVREGDNTWPGMAIVPVSKEIRSQLEIPSGIDGVMVAALTPDSPSQVTGFKRGDIITHMNDQEIDTPKDFYRQLNRNDINEVRFRINRGGMEIIFGLRSL